ncbi:MAG: hypothetical protein ABDH66_05895 [Bacteroidia bacterium]
MKRFNLCITIFILSILSWFSGSSLLTAQVTVMRISKQRAYQLGAPMSKVQLMPIAGLQVRRSVVQNDIYNTWDTLKTYAFTLGGQKIIVEEKDFGEQAYRASPKGQTYLGNQPIVVFSVAGWEWAGTEIYYNPRKKPVSYRPGLEPYLYRIGNRIYGVAELLDRALSVFDLGPDNQVRHFIVSLFPERYHDPSFKSPFDEDVWVGPSAFGSNILGNADIWYVKDNPNCIILHMKERPQDREIRQSMSSYSGRTTSIPTESFYLICWTARDMKME